MKHKGRRRCTPFFISKLEPCGQRMWKRMLLFLPEKTRRGVKEGVVVLVRENEEEEWKREVLRRSVEKEWKTKLSTFKIRVKFQSTPLFSLFKK